MKSCTNVCEGVQQLFSCMPLKANLSLSYYHMCKTLYSLVMCFNRTAVIFYLIQCDINRTQPLLRISYISSCAPSYKCADTACVTCHLPPLQKLFFFFFCHIRQTVFSLYRALDQIENDSSYIKMLIR